MSATDHRVLTRTEGGVATITLDSPHNRNALSRQLVRELHGALSAAAEDDAVRCVVLTHTGGTFCAGADLSEGSTGDAARERSDELVELLRGIVSHPKPVIGRIDGHVRAGGMGLVGACDLVVASKAASFALTEARLGLAASVISLTVLPRLQPRSASRYFLTGSTFDVEEAARIGLVTSAVGTTDDLTTTVEELTADLSRCSPQGLRETKALITHDLLAHLDEHRDRVADQSTRLFASPEAREGMAAFLGRRPPEWAR